MITPPQPPSIEQFYLFFIAALLGGLIGLERQFTSSEEESSLVGVRTFIFITFLGALSAMISTFYLPWFIAVGFAGLAALMLARFVFAAQRGHLGTTTEITELLAFIIGAITWWGHIRLAIALAVGITVVLSMKPELHRMTKIMSADDIRAILKFAVLTFIVMPILPDRAVDPWGLFNPYEVWTMVVLIAGVSFVGYALLKFVKLRGGIEWTGAIGGVISSTATTLGFSRRSVLPDNRSLARHLALGILLACVVMYPRLLLILVAAGPDLVKPLTIPFFLMVLAGAVASIIWWRTFRERGDMDEAAKFRNPMEIGVALYFGLIYAAIRILATLAQRQFGEGGLLLTAALSGIADVDAIALSIAKMVGATTPDKLDASIGAKAVVLAAASNCVTKSAIVWFVAAKEVKKPVIAGLLSMTVVGVAYILIF